MLSKAVTGYPTLHMLVRKTTCEVCETPDDVTAAFCEVHSAHEEITDDVCSDLERFAILMHDRNRTSVSRNETRIPLIHAKGASNGSSSSIGGCCYTITCATRGDGWGTATQSYRQLPSPGDCGWTIKLNGSIFLKPVYHAKSCSITGAGRDAKTASIHWRT